jgi:hypothetical protein
MNELKQTISRRSVLQRSLLFVAGACGLQLAPSTGRAAEVPPDGRATLTLYSPSWRARSPGQRPGKLPTRSGLLNRHGDLLDGVSGKKVGEFTATCFGSDSSFPPASSTGFNLELQTLRLQDGTLFGIGSGSEEQKVHAILGGTGRFAGAKGSYVVRRTAQGPKEGAVEFVINLLA